MVRMKLTASFLLLAAAALPSEPITNEIIVKLVQSGVPTETIVRTIQAADSFRFGTVPGDLMRLQQAQVPDEVIRALAGRINWPGTPPLVIAHAPLTPLPDASVRPEAKSAQSRANRSLAHKIAQEAKRDSGKSQAAVRRGLHLDEKDRLQLAVTAYTQANQADGANEEVSRARNLTGAIELLPEAPSVETSFTATQARIDEISEWAGLAEHRAGNVVLADVSSGTHPVTSQTVSTEPAPAPPPPAKPVSQAHESRVDPVPDGEMPDAAGYHALGRQLLQSGDLAAALLVLTRAIELDPNLPQAYNARGYAHLRLKHYANAIMDFDRAIRLRPGYENAYVNRAVARRLTGDTAGEAVDQALARDLARTH